MNTIYIYIYLYTYIERERDRDRDKANKKEVWFDFHMQNLKHFCYEIANFNFNGK